MKWKSDEEKEFKLKYAEACQSLSIGYMKETINQRLRDIENHFKNNQVEEETYHKVKHNFETRLKWVQEVDDEIAQSLKEEDVTLEQIATDFSAKKVKSKLKDIRDEEVS